MWRYVLAGAFLVWVARCEQAKAAKPIIRNPRRRRNPNGLNAADKQTLAEAERIAGEFHGENGPRMVVELSESERLLPRYVVSLGQVPELRYEPNRGSKRAGYTYIHESGDRGWLGENAKEKPLLCVDPVSRRPLLVPLRSPIRMESDKGLVG